MWLDLDLLYSIRKTSYQYLCCFIFKLLELVFYNFYKFYRLCRFYGIHLGKTRMKNSLKLKSNGADVYGNFPIFYFAVLSLVSSILTLTLISCDRFFGIVFAMKARMTERRSPWFILGVWICAIGISSPLLIYRQQFKVGLNKNSVQGPSYILL